MPWTTRLLEQLTKEVGAEIKQHFGVLPTSPVSFCTQEELITRIQKSTFYQQLSSFEKERLDVELPFVMGKYFLDMDEIWLVYGKGEQRPIVFHEMLHSIQKCHSHREKIVQYLIWYYTRKQGVIDPFTLKDWTEIERSVGLPSIKQRLVTPGDCEDF